MGLEKSQGRRNENVLVHFSGFLTNEVNSLYISTEDGRRGRRTWKRKIKTWFVRFLLINRKEVLFCILIGASPFNL